MRAQLAVLLILMAGCQAPRKGTDAGPSFAAPYTETPFNNVKITSNGAGPNFQKANASVDFHDGPFASVKLVVSLTSPCYPFSKWQTDPPPSGQNYPADCDAFDRNFDFTFDPAQSASDPPGFNVAHAITPFGGPEQLNEDITDLANAKPGMHTLQVVIPTYSDSSGQITGSAGSWNVTATIEATPGVPPHQVLAAIPLYQGSSPIMETPITFQIPAGTQSARLEMRTSGHGGVETSDSACIGPAEEFCHRQLAVDVDGQALSAIDPWRTDCENFCGEAEMDHQEYCDMNPCGEVASVCADRANWCPGSETAPFVWDTGALHVAGQHTLSWQYNTIISGGTWLVSATYYAYGN